ncbi:methionyl-tRNA formyltransferase [Endozoicomonas sp. SCSIO W0465]|uniref:methionyl-tRNA formyltransferase n=1 Tax=Endozoicomonas sp. SCSIO W0465 TaxID=2918516 RepID=UPI002074B815|nr:methionyl-tRNA formyltransferase [Endozoicomonas sp. SCSIO W0465]USE36687.1 methionyl-tRNA formyltransferase [Endozoicomonas sp. SCSIO W0465]
MKSLRIIFAGTPEFASAHLQAVLDSQHQVIAVYTQPDRPAGRGQKLMPSPVKSLALEHHIPVFQPTSLRNADAQKTLASLNADLMVVVAYGLILPQTVLDTPTLGCINVHGSILPRWRGAAPVQRAIEAGDTESGVTIMQMDAGLDTGDMLLKAFCPIHPTDTASDLHDRLIKVGQPALIQSLDNLADGNIHPEKQDDNLANYAHKMSKEEARLDWQKSAQALERQIRAFNPWPVAITALDDTNIRVWEAMALEESTSNTPGTLIRADKKGLDIACGQGDSKSTLRIKRLQLAGSRAMTVQELLNSKKAMFSTGKQFS